MSCSVDNLTAVLYKPNDLRLEKREIPVPKDDEVLVKMECVGICGSDIHYYVHGKIADFIVKEPMVVGHESSGQVCKVGKNVKHLKPGDRVAIEPGVPCRLCSFCKGGRYNLCPDVKFCATPPVDGNLCQYYTHAADFCFKLPDNVSYEEGALLEPLSVGVMACRKGNVSVGNLVLILGSGPVGLVNLLTAKAMGAAKVLVTDLLDYKLQLAKELGADFTLKVGPQDDAKELAKRITCYLGAQPDVTIDCSGFPATVKLGLEVTKTGGCLVLVGLGADELTIATKDASCREIDIKGSFRYANCYPTALSMVASGKVNVKKLITHTFKLEQTVEAFETARDGKGNPIKVMLYCNKSG